MLKVNNKNVLKYIALIAVLFTFISCGYKPTSYYAKKQIDEKVFVNLFIDMKEPRNAVLIKDSLNQLLIQKLGSKLVYKKEHANVIMNLKLDSIKMEELQYDEKGFNKLYRAIATIFIDYKNIKKGISNKFSLDGEHNFSIDDGTTITDIKRFDAIKEASSNALDEALSKLAVLSFKK